MACNPYSLQSASASGVGPVPVFGSTPTAGNLLIAVWHHESGSTPATPSGWSSLGTVVTRSPRVFGGFWKISDGTETGITISLTNLAVVIVYEYEAPPNGFAGVVDTVASSTFTDPTNTLAVTSTTDGLAVGLYGQRPSSAPINAFISSGMRGAAATGGGADPRVVMAAARPAHVGEPVGMLFSNPTGAPGGAGIIIATFEENDPPEIPSVDVRDWSAMVTDTAITDTVAATVPASVQANDVIVALLMTQEDVVTPPAGFVLDVGEDDAGSPTQRAQIWSKPSDGTEGGTSISFELAAATNRKALQLLVLSPVDGAAAVRFLRSAEIVDPAPGTGNVDHTTPSVVADVAGSVVVGLLSCRLYDTTNQWRPDPDRGMFHSVNISEGRSATSLAYVLAPGAVPAHDTLHMGGGSHAATVTLAAVYEPGIPPPVPASGNRMGGTGAIRKPPRYSR